jgi:hypothetical protein
MEWMSCDDEISNKFCTVEFRMVDKIKHGLKQFGSSLEMCLSNLDLFWWVFSMMIFKSVFAF